MNDHEMTVKGLGLHDLLEILTLEPLEKNLYRGQNRDIGTGRVFGGQVLAQALVAAQNTVDSDDRMAHSLHGYFILPGDLEAPVVYQVEGLPAPCSGERAPGLARCSNLPWPTSENGSPA